MTAEHRPHRESGAVLDIGGDIGALLFYVGPERDGEEIDLVPTDPSAPTTHTQVHPRDIEGGTVYAGLFPSVPAGDYRLQLIDGGVPVSVRGGEVTTLPPD